MAAKSKVTEKTPLTTPLTATPKPPRRTELDTTALDGLRGFAAMHLGLGEWLLRAYPDLPVDLAHHASMCTFYVLSGYVLGLVYLKPNQVVFTCCSPADANDGTPRFRHGRFFVRRLARLYPMYLLANGIAAIVDIKLNGMWGLPDDYKSGERLVLVLFVATAFIRAPFLDWFYTTCTSAQPSAADHADQPSAADHSAAPPAMRCQACVSLSRARCRRRRFVGRLAPLPDLRTRSMEPEGRRSGLPSPPAAAAAGWHAHSRARAGQPPAAVADMRVVRALMTPIAPETHYCGRPSRSCASPSSAPRCSVYRRVASPCLAWF
jgi:hypothetical protein